MTPLLQLDDIRVHFPARTSLFGKRPDPFRAVDGVSLNIAPGEILGLVGESGCGKTTLSRAIMQLQPLTSGRILLENRDLSSLNAAALRLARLDFQMVFQDPYASLNPRLTIFSTLAEAITARSGQLDQPTLRSRVAALMERVGLSPSAALKYPHEFSGGQRQRLCLARALMAKPWVLCGDDATSALDALTERTILAGLRRDLRGTAVLLIASKRSTVQLADRVVLLANGRIAADGTHAELIGDNPAYRELLGLRS
jgi:ABC-type glutathione transport system ATPase component